MRKKLLFVVNPRSGKGQIRASLLDIVNLFCEKGYEVRVHATQSVNDGYEEVMAYGKKSDLIVCSGGDGTLAEVVRAIKDQGLDLPLGYIPAGSTNDFAASLGIPKNMNAAAQALLNGRVYHCDIGSFNKRAFVYVAAFGMFTEVAYSTDQNMKNALGHLAYVIEGMKRLFDINSYKLVIEGDDFYREGEFIYGMVTNSRSVGGFKNLTGKNVMMDDGLFEVTLIHMPKTPLQFNEIMAALINAVDDTDMVDTFKTSRLEIHSDIEIPWTLDGEFGGSPKDIVIENDHKALQILLDPEGKNKGLKGGPDLLIREKESAAFGSGPNPNGEDNINE